MEKKRLSLVSLIIAIVIIIASSGIAYWHNILSQRKNKWPDKESQRAFEQEKNANIVVNFETWDRIFLEKPSILTENKEMFRVLSLEEFTDLIMHFKGNKKLAVVIMSKSWSLKPHRDQASDMDKIEDILRKYGFRKIIFQQARSDCRPILRE